MATKRKTIGVILDWPGTSDNYQRKILNGIQDRLEKEDFNIYTMAVGRIDSPFPWESGRNYLLDFVNQETFCGLIVYSACIANFCDDNVLIEFLNKCSDIPIITIGSNVADYPAVNINNSKNMEQMVKHFVLEHGSKKIAFVGGPEDNPEAVERKKVVYRTAEKLSVPIKDGYYYEGTFLLKSGADAVKEFLDIRKLDIDTIICANDEMAIGVWQELWARKISIPEDIIISGFDNIKISEKLDLPLTTISQPFASQGYIATDKLINMISGNKEDSIVLETNMIYRKSCGCRVVSGENIVDKSIKAFFDEHKSTFIDQLKSKDKHDDLQVEWRKFVLYALDMNIRQVEIEEFLIEIKRTVLTDDLPEMEYLYLKDLLSELKFLLNDKFIQSELLSRKGDDDDVYNTLFSMENFEQRTVASSSIELNLDELESILKHLSISKCYISLFDNDSSSEGESVQIFCYDSGKRLEIDESNSVFKTISIVNQNYLPETKCHLVINPLYKGEEQYGLIAFDSAVKSTRSHDMVYRSLSGVLHSMNSTRSILKANRKLEDEVKARIQTGKKLEEALVKLENLSITDELTNLYNRRGFMTMATQLLKLCVRANEPAAILYIDLDGLKPINDNYGHEDGDFAIKTVANVLSGTFREVDVVSRLGGDEFTVFVGNCDEVQVPKIIERLYRKCKIADEKSEKDYPISFSVGYCSYSIKASTIELMMSRADANMYEAKKERKMNRQ